MKFFICELEPNKYLLTNDEVEAEKHNILDEFSSRSTDEAIGFLIRNGYSYEDITTKEIKLEMVDISILNATMSAIFNDESISTGERKNLEKMWNKLKSSSSFAHKLHKML